MELSIEGEFLPIPRARSPPPFLNQQFSKIAGKGSGVMTDVFLNGSINEGDIFASFLAERGRMNENPKP